MNQVHYFLSPVDVMDNDKVLRFLPRALISQRSIYRAFDDTPEVRQAFLEGKIYTVKVNGNFMKTRLVRESGQDGTHYNLRILHMDNVSESNHLLQMKKLGFESPWKREYPRLAIEGLLPKVEVPVSVLFPRLTGKVCGEVANFSYHGLMFEILCGSLSLGEFVGQKLQIQLITSKGKMLEAHIKIVRIYDEVYAPGKVIRGFGLKFLHLTQEDRKYYNGLILDACKELQRGYS